MDLLTRAQVAHRLSISISSVKRHEKHDATWPVRLNIGPRSPRWRAADIDRWVKSTEAHDDITLVLSADLRPKAA
jgi:predicted DNA-binding transcriptional regulator AlpA